MSIFNSLLPSNASELERAIEQISAQVEAVPIDFQKIWRPYDCPPELLPWLAWAFNVDLWQSDWSVETKREVIATAIEWHRHKGTPWSIKHMLKFAGAPDTSILEWWQQHPTGPFDPHTFCLVVWSDPSSNPRILDQDFLEYIRDFVDISKPVRSHFCLHSGLRAQTAGLNLGVGVKQQAVLSLAVANPDQSLQGVLEPVIGSTLNAGSVLRLDSVPVSQDVVYKVAPAAVTAGLIEAFQHESMRLMPLSQEYVAPMRIISCCKSAAITSNLVAAAPVPNKYISLVSAAVGFSFKQLARVSVDFLHESTAVLPVRMGASLRFQGVVQ